MRRRLALIVLMAICLIPGLCFADAPKTIAGITLGANIADVNDRIDMNSSLPIWGSEYLSKASLKPIKGYQGGYVVFGNCKAPGRIVRIKLNYLDDSEDFYNRLHAAFTKRFGKPSEWRGNPFGNLKIWKWSLKDDGNNSISVILQRYEGDDDSFTLGNSVKMSVTNYVEEENACNKAKEETDKEKAVVPPEKLDFDSYLPH